MTTKIFILVIIMFVWSLWGWLLYISLLLKIIVSMKRGVFGSFFEH